MQTAVLLKYLDDFYHKRILIVGDVMLDEYKWGEVNRVSPEAPVPVVELKRTTWTLGGAANVAANVTSLGGLAILGGVIGEDVQGNILREILGQVNIESGLLAIPDRQTSTKTRIIAHNQQIVRVDNEERQPIPRQLEMELLEWVEKHLKEVDILLLSDYAKGVITPRIAQGIIHLAHKANKLIAVDPKGPDYQKYRGSSIITPNVQEARLAVNHLIDVTDSPVEICHKLLTLLDGSAVLMTMGAEGMTLFQPQREPVHIPTVARHVYDVTGAGDTVIATCALAMATGAGLEEAAQLANVAAGIKVGKIGTATVSQEELRAAMGKILN